MSRFICFIAFVFLLSGTAQAQMGGGGGGMAQPEPIVIPDVEVETLLVEIPDKWGPFNRRTDTKTDTFYFPFGSSPERWSNAVHIQRFFTTLDLASASDYFDAKTAANAKACAEHDVSFLRGGTENGYSRVEWSEHCVLANKDELSTLNKVILGNEKLYTVSRMWKSKPDQDEMNEWSTYMCHVFLPVIRLRYKIHVYRLTALAELAVVWVAVAAWVAMVVLWVWVVMVVMAVLWAWVTMPVLWVAAMVELWVWVWVLNLSLILTKTKTSKIALNLQR